MKLTIVLSFILAAVAHVAVFWSLGWLPGVPRLFASETVHVRIVERPRVKPAEQPFADAPDVSVASSDLPAEPADEKRTDKNLGVREPEFPVVKNSNSTAQSRMAEDVANAKHASSSAPVPTSASIASGSSTSGSSTSGLSTSGSPDDHRNPCGTLRVPKELLGQGLFPRRYIAKFAVDNEWALAHFDPAPGIVRQQYLDRMLRRIFEKCIPALKQSVLPQTTALEPAEFSFPVEFVE